MVDISLRAYRSKHWTVVETHGASPSENRPLKATCGVRKHFAAKGKSRVEAGDLFGFRFGTLGVRRQGDKVGS